MAILLGMFLNNLRAATPQEKYLDMEDLGLNPWLELYDVRTPVVGYDDNVLLTDADKKGSGFVENGRMRLLSGCPSRAIGSFGCRWMGTIADTGAGIRAWTMRICGR